ncbi:MAG: hypothetical protein FWC43_10020, partial [Planctomycetaceae bacterium]|nr:hypothetical protein [Planctomycetaceae bacterium]
MDHHLCLQSVDEQSVVGEIPTTRHPVSHFTQICTLVYRNPTPLEHRNKRIAKSLGTQASSLREGCGMESPLCAGRMP